MVLIHGVSFWQSALPVVVASVAYTGALLGMATAVTVACAARACGGAAVVPRGGAWLRWCAVACALLAFLCVPWGALPALAAWSGQGWVALGLALCSLCIDSTVSRQQKAREALYMACVSGVFCCVAQAALASGMPGDVYSFDTYVTTPLLGCLRGGRLCGLVLLALPLLPWAGGESDSGLASCVSVAANLRHGLYAALWWCLMVPQGLRWGLGWGGMAGVAVDAGYFLLALGALCVATRWVRCDGVICRVVRVAAILTGCALLLWG